MSGFDNQRDCFECDASKETIFRGHRQYKSLTEKQHISIDQQAMC